MKKKFLLYLIPFFFALSPLNVHAEENIAIEQNESEEIIQEQVECETEQLEAPPGNEYHEDNYYPHEEPESPHEQEQQPEVELSTSQEDNNDENLQSGQEQKSEEEQSQVAEEKTPVSVYMYTKVEADEETLQDLTLNKDGWYTIGEVSVPIDNADNGSSTYITSGADWDTLIAAVANATRYSANSGIDLNDIDWSAYGLKTDNGACDFISSGRQWHLDGKIIIVKPVTPSEDEPDTKEEEEETPSAQYTNVQIFYLDEDTNESIKDSVSSIVKVGTVDLTGYQVDIEGYTFSKSTPANIQAELNKLCEFSLYYKKNVEKKEEEIIPIPEEKEEEEIIPTPAPAPEEEKKTEEPIIPAEEKKEEIVTPSKDITPIVPEIKKEEVVEIKKADTIPAAPITPTSIITNVTELTNNSNYNNETAVVSVTPVINSVANKINTVKTSEVTTLVEESQTVEAEEDIVELAPVDNSTNIEKTITSEVPLSNIEVEDSNCIIHLIMLFCEVLYFIYLLIAYILTKEDDEEDENDN